MRVRGALDDFGRRGSGSSMLMDFFPSAPGTKDFLLSFLEIATGAGVAACGRSSSPERLMRANILDCFRGTVVKSPVGAVLRISGAIVTWLAESPEPGEKKSVSVGSNEPRGTGGAESSA